MTDLEPKVKAFIVEGRADSKIDVPEGGKTDEGHQALLMTIKRRGEGCTWA
jgi:hypothetical protein